MTRTYPPVVITMDSLPKPTGEYQVGTCKFKLYDRYRPEIFYPSGRLIPIQIYFPIKKETHKLAPKVLEENAPRVFSQIFYHVYSLQSDINNLSEGLHSLVFLNHGLVSAMTDYSAIAEDLASNGYVVVTIQHQLNTDPIEEPESWKSYSFALHSRCIDNILHVFKWVNDNNGITFQNKIDTSKIAFIGHSLGTNSILMLSNRISGSLKTKPKVTLLPHKNNIESVKECVIVMDFDSSFVYPKHIAHPMLFLVSEERKNMLKNSGIFEDIISIGHSIIYYTPSKHISFFDQAYIDVRDPVIPQLFYFNGNVQERIRFFDNLRKDILAFLKKQCI